MLCIGDCITCLILIEVEVDFAYNNFFRPSVISELHEFMELQTRYMEYIYQLFKQKEIILKRFCINSNLVNIINKTYDEYLKILINNFELIKIN